MVKRYIFVMIVIYQTTIEHTYDTNLTERDTFHFLQKNEININEYIIMMAIDMIIKKFTSENSLSIMTEILV